SDSLRWPLDRRGGKTVGRCCRSRWARVARVHGGRLYQPLKLEEDVRLLRVGATEQRQRRVEDRHAARRLAAGRAIVGVTMEDDRRAEVIDRLRQARRAEEGNDFGWFALDGLADRRVVQHHYALLGAGLGQGAFQPQG